MTAGDRPVALVLRALGLGDLLAAVPALRGLRRGLTGTGSAWRVVLATPASLAPLARLTGAVDDVLPTPGLAPLRWRRRPPDLAVNLHGRGPQSHDVLVALRPGRTVGFARPDRPTVIGPRWRADEHEVARWCRLVRYAGWPADPADLSLPLPGLPSPAPGAVVVHPGAASGSRRWPEERFAALARGLRVDGHRVVVTGSDGEREPAERVASAAGLDPTAVLAGRTGLLDLAALVAAASLVVCGDTGVGHLATAYGTPSVLLFGPVSPTLWGPPPERAGRHVALWHPRGVPGDPHADAVDPSLCAISVDEVLAAARRALAAVLR